MKKLISILLCAISINAAAQDGKPTKEETINFIDRMVKETVGTWIDKSQMIDATFTGISFVWKSNLHSLNEIAAYKTYKYVNINWNTFKILTAHDQNNGLTMLRLFFLRIIC